MPRKNTNLVDSIRARLLNLARERREDYQVTLRNFFYERLLYRLSKSPLKDRFVLKGAMLFRLWADQPYRATMDLDLLSRGDNSPESVKKDIAVICATKVEADGVEFDGTDVTAEPIRAEDEYSGIRATFPASLGSIRERLQVDIGFGDALWPRPKQVKYPAMLDLPAATVTAYRPETVIAEKLEAMITLALKNSRIKDYFDIHYLLRHERFEGKELAEAVRRTLGRRKTAISDGIPVALSDDYWKPSSRQAHVQAFAKRARLDTDLSSARKLAAELRKFLMPVLTAVRRAEAFDRIWIPPGPWR